MCFHFPAQTDLGSGTEFTKKATDRFTGKGPTLNTSAASSAARILPENIYDKYANNGRYGFWLALSADSASFWLLQTLQIKDHYVDI